MIKGKLKAISNVEPIIFAHKSENFEIALDILEAKGKYYFNGEELGTDEVIVADGVAAFLGRDDINLIYYISGKWKMEKTTEIGERYRLFKRIIQIVEKSELLFKDKRTKLDLSVIQEISSGKNCIDIKWVKDRTCDNDKQMILPDNSEYDKLYCAGDYILAKTFSFRSKSCYEYIVYNRVEGRVKIRSLLELNAVNFTQIELSSDIKSRRIRGYESVILQEDGVVRDWDGRYLG